MDKHSELKQRLKLLMIQHPVSYKNLAKQIGIDLRSLMDFMENRRQTSVLILMMIEKYVIERERNDE